MLINALCNYYDLLEREGKVLSPGFSSVNIHYAIALTEDGEVDEIIDLQREVDTGRKKPQIRPVEMIFPERTQKTGIEANVIEHRPRYIFGLNLNGEELTDKDSNDTAKKSHLALVDSNVEIFKDAQSPLVKAYVKFLKRWQPSEEVENKKLLSLKKKYTNSNYAFCLSGNPTTYLHEDAEAILIWKDLRKNEPLENNDKEIHGQCSITGEQRTIARLHDKIKGIYGGVSTGGVLVGYNNDAECSYNNKQSYNSNISEVAMKKYCEALNYLLKEQSHKVILDDTTILFWAMSSEKEEEPIDFSFFCSSGGGEQEGEIGAGETQSVLNELFKDACKGGFSKERLKALDIVDEHVDFYIVGLKPNASRISIKFFVRKKYIDVLWNILKFQQEMQVGDKERLFYVWQIHSELLSPKSKNDKLNPTLMAKMFQAIINDTPFPSGLLEIVVRRVKIDCNINIVRAGLIKACINRQKEELLVALDKTNENQGYLCGRLFAVLEKLQQDASGGKLNRTIKNAYFASACSKPAMVYPKLMRLAQTHLNKIEYEVYYQKMIGEIMDHLEGEFPDTLKLKDQGRFLVGYYQQNQELWKKKEKKETNQENQ